MKLLKWLKNELAIFVPRRRNPPGASNGYDSALAKMQEAYQELKAQGWNDAIYCPKDGSTFISIEAGSTGLHETIYMGEWPEGGWWIMSGGDLWPSRPILWKAKES